MTPTAGKLVVGWCAILIITLILFPLCFKYLYIFKQHENESFVRNRFPSAAYLWCGCIMQEMMVNVIQAVHYGYSLSIANNRFYSAWYQLGAMATFLAVLLKYWLIVFKFKNQYAIKNEKWQMILVPQLTKKSPSFWIKYKQIFGM